MNNGKAMRIGIGYDVHRLVEGRRLVLGGVAVPHEKGLLGHSDADVLLHAIIDAMLGAVALGDIGGCFPDTDFRYRDIDSVKLLKEVDNRVRGQGYRLTNLDAVIVAEKPRLAAYIPRMRRCISDVLAVSIDQVSVKATTSEGLGFTGREAGIAAQAAVILAPI